MLQSIFVLIVVFSVGIAINVDRTRIETDNAYYRKRRITPTQQQPNEMGN